MRILDLIRGSAVLEHAVAEHKEVERAVEAAAQGDPGPAGFWLSLAAQKRKLDLAARSSPPRRNPRRPAP